MSEEPKDFETLVLNALSNKTGYILLEELERMYGARISYQVGMSFDEVANREGERRLAQQLIDIVRNGSNA